MQDKQRVLDLFSEHQEALYTLGDQLFQSPELGFREQTTNSLITSYLDEAGIGYTNDIAVTGIKATIGTGNYHIGLIAEMDAVAVGSQDNIHNFHCCGHSVQVAVMLAVFKTLHQSGILDALDGKVSFIATPAEEYIDLDYRRELVRQGKIRYLSGKQNMIAAGVFDDLDCVLSTHVTGDQTILFDVNSSLAGFTVKKISFVGKASHSGAAPHLGKNALHGASLCLTALSYLQEQFPREANVHIHPVLTQSGASMNIIPDMAVLETYVRANTKDHLMDAQSKLDLCAQHCAQALGLECIIENTVGYMPLTQSKPLCDVVYNNMLSICDKDKIAKDLVSGASGDIGDLGFLLPAVQFGFSGIDGRIHSDQFSIRDKQHVYGNTGRVVLGTVIDLLSNPSLQVNNPRFAQDKEYYVKHWLMQDTAK